MATARRLTMSGGLRLTMSGGARLLQSSTPAPAPAPRRPVPFSPLMFRDRARLYALTDGIDDGGGKTADYLASGDVLPCRVTRLASRAKDLADVTETETQFELSFPARPGGRKGDLFAWLDPDNPTAELTRIAVTEAATPRDPRGRLWIAYGVIVQ